MIDTFCRDVTHSSLSYSCEQPVVSLEELFWPAFLPHIPPPLNGYGWIPGPQTALCIILSLSSLVCRYEACVRAEGTHFTMCKMLERCNCSEEALDMIGTFIYHNASRRSTTVGCHLQVFSKLVESALPRKWAANMQPLHSDRLVGTGFTPRCGNSGRLPSPRNGSRQKQTEPNKVLPGLEPGLKDSESLVITITL